MYASESVQVLLVVMISSGLAGGQLGVAAFLLSLTPKTLGGGIYVALESLGSKGLFPAMILALLAVEVMRICYKHNLTFRMPEQVPESVSRSFGAVVPAFIIMGVMTLISVVFKIDVVDVVQQGLSPLVKAGDSLPGVLVPAFLVVFLWFFGISGDSVVGSVARPVWLQYLSDNADAVASGVPGSSHRTGNVLSVVRLHWWLWGDYWSSYCRVFSWESKVYQVNHASGRGSCAIQY